MLDELIPYNPGLVSYRRNPLWETSTFPISTPESPETAIARRDPVEAARLLRRVSKDRVTEKALENSAKIARDYLSCVPIEKLVESRGIKVSFRKKQGLFSREDLGFDFDIDLK
jgi:hypothetical protein